MKLPIKYLLGLLFLLLSVFNESNAQVYPVAVNPMQMGPMSIYFDDFYSVIQPKIKVLVTLNDLTVGQHDVYLKVKLTGPSLTIQTIPGQKPNQATTLFSGIPLDLTGVDLEPFFDFNKLSFSGILRSKLETNSRLPEGAYNLCFTVMDYESNTPLSSETCVPLQLALSEPPQIINPSFGGVVTDIVPSNFMLNWMLTNSNSLVDINNVSYQINLYEVTSTTTDPKNAILNNQALLIWQSPLINQYVYNYGITDPPLEIGKRYVFNVQAIENYPRSQIKNNGFSAPSWFYFGYPVGGSITMVTPDDNYQFKLTDPGVFRWKKPNNAIPNQWLRYDIKIVEVDSNQTKEDAIVENASFDAYTTEPTNDNTISYVMTNEKLNSMDRMQHYAWKVTGKTGNQTTAESPVYAFTGPPYLDGFYAANFYVEIVTLNSFDTLTGEISGRGRVRVNSGPTDFAEFNFDNIFLAQVGNNLWILNSGNIRDQIIYNSYTFEPTTVNTNGPITFQPDSIYITTNYLYLGGKLYWQLPIISQNNSPSIFESKYTFLNLSPGSYLLATEQPVKMDENENIPLLEPYGFELKLEYTSELFVYQSKYTASLDGFIQLPNKVKDVDGSTLLMPFSNQASIHYMIENGQSPAPERIDFLTDSDFGLRGKKYVIDLNENLSPGDMSVDSTWKGVYFNEVNLMIPEDAEESGQLSSNEELTVFLPNLLNDSTIFFVDNTGLNVKASIPFTASQQLYFNTFPSTNTILSIDIQENEFQSGSLIGGIYIPFLDTVNAFNYTVPLTNFGFQIGNIDESLVGLNFKHNAGGSDEEKVEMQITRAIFKNKERIELDLDAQWNKFDVTLSNLQNLNIWGNGNIGFDIPNGAASLNNQAIAKSGDYTMVIDYVGCGRDQNAYAFGVSAKMNMAENISGIGGAPVVNAYSMYLNPLLNGQFVSNGNSNSILPGFNTGSGDSTVSSTTVAHLNNLNHSLGDFADSIGVDLSDSLTTGSDLIGDDNYIQMGDILNLVEMFIPFIDSTKQYKAQDYVTVGRQIIETDAYKALTSKNPKEYVQDVLLEAADGIAQKINQPLINATNKVNEKINGVVNQYVRTPIANTVDTILTRIFDEIESATLGTIDEEEVSLRNTLISIIDSAKLEIRNEIVNGVNKSIDSNVTVPITSFIKGAVTKKITTFVNEQIKYVAEEFIIEGVNADIKLSSIIQNADTLINDLSDTLVDAFKHGGSIKNIVETGKSLVNDALDNMDWSQVRQNILNKAANAGVSALLMAGLNQIFDNFDAGILEGLMNNVSFDFSNLGEKIQDGDLTGIVKFDPTNIKIETKACKIQGQLNHVDDDPQYGDHWRATVGVQLVKPEKLKTVTFEAMFITGKTNYSTSTVTYNQLDSTAQSELDSINAGQPVDTSVYSYWFASMNVQGFKIPLGPIPLALTGVEGFAYHHMQKANPTAIPLPCRDNKLGLGIGLDFVDCQYSPNLREVDGKVLKLETQLEVIINNSDWAMELYTQANFSHQAGSSTFEYSDPIATATGMMGYYSNIKTFRGQIDVVFHTEPKLCAGGTIKFNFDGMNNTWLISAGTEEQPMFAKLLCKDWLAVSAFIEAENSGLTAGIDLNIDIQAKSPWIDFGSVQVRGVAAFYVQLDTYVDVEFQPQFRLVEAYVYLNMGANIGVDYKIGGSENINNFTVAGIALSGNALYRAAPEGTLAGGLSGSVTVLGVSCSLSINVNYDFGNRSDNS